MDLFDRSAGTRPGNAQEEILEGTIERIVFSGGGGEFTVARLTRDGAAEPVTVVGSLLGLPQGARLRLRGSYENNPRFGRQFRVQSYTELSPETLAGIRRYLGAGLIKGIGPEFASRIVARFGIRTLEILDAQPERIREVPGIGPSRAQAIQNAWTSQRRLREVMVFLQGYGVSPAFAARIYKRYGAAAIARVRENPFRLAFDVWGIGFLSADRLATALGIARDSDVRVQAGVRHALDQAGGLGHVFLPRSLLVEEAAKLLEVEPPLVEAAVDRLGRAGEVAIESTPEGAAVFEVGLFRAEAAAAAGLLRLLRSQGSPLRVDADRAIARYQAEARITLAPQQAVAVRRALCEPLLVITGGPGVGKTTIVRGIVNTLVRQGLTVALAAPTGRAAKRLQEATGQPAATLHRLLEWRPADGVFGRNSSRPLPADLLVIDEASMIDIRLMADVLAALADGTRLLLVGDVDQLPSVGPGMVLTNAHRIHDGVQPELGAPPAQGRGADQRDFFFIEDDDPAHAAETIRDLVTSRLPRRYGFSPHDIQVLTPMHRGELGATTLNQLLQEAITPGRPELRSGGRVFRVGDRVMQIRNNYDRDVFNGDVGEVLRVAGGSGEASESQAVVGFDEREVSYAADDLDELTLAYAATVHKSQGSEYPVVIVPVHTQHYVMLQRSLLYTAVTRGKKLVVLIGSRKALRIAVGNAEVAARYSRLAARLAAG